MNKPPCYDCKHRTLSCHMACESYLQYKRIIEIEVAKENRRHEAEIMGYTINNIYKFKKAIYKFKKAIYKFKKARNLPR